MPNKKQLKKVEDFVRSQLSELNLIHTMAMRPIGLELAKAEGADIKIVDWSILFHDVAKDRVAFSEHAKSSAEMCRRFLQELELEEEFIDAVVHCVETHSWAWVPGDPKPETIEEKLVFDADMIQQLGDMGIVKHILKYRNEKFIELLAKAKADLKKAAEIVITDAGKFLVKKRINKVLQFFENAKEGK